jgi:hypothetical protein
MKRYFPRSLSREDLRSYHRWRMGFLAFYFAVVVVALGLTSANRPAQDLRASRDTQLALEKHSGSIGQNAGRPAAKQPRMIDKSNMWRV